MRRFSRRRAALLAGQLVLVLLPALFLREKEVAAEETTRVPAPPSARQLFRARCSRCHEPDGSGRDLREALPGMPDFTSSRWHSRRSNAELLVTILEGKGTQMPAFGAKISRRQAADLVAVIRSLGSAKVRAAPRPKEKARPRRHPVAARVGPPASARRLFEARCSRCHEADGTGSGLRGTLAGMPDFTSRQWHQGRSNAQLVVSILEGKGTQMPAFGAKISRQEAGDLVAVIRAFGPGLGPAAREAEDDFPERFRALEVEFDRLSKQLDELSPRPRRKR